MGEDFVYVVNLTGTMASVTSDRIAMYEETPDPNRAIIEQNPTALFLEITITYYIVY